MDNYEKFKKDVFTLTKIDLNAYKEKQMRRRITAAHSSGKPDSCHFLQEPAGHLHGLPPLQGQPQGILASISSTPVREAG